MTRIKDVVKVVNGFAPFSLAESWDNVGLLVGSEYQPVDKVLVALDATQAVVEEAVRSGAQLLVTHHPVIFSPIKKLHTGDIAYQLAQAGIGVVCAHTNLDIAPGGVNDVLAQCLGLTGLRGLDNTGRRPYYKVAVMVPAQNADKLYHAMADAGAGTLGDYSRCGFLVRGEGRFLPEAGANPYLGAVGQPEAVEEIRLEMLAAPDRLAGILSAMKKAHPYEEPAFDVYHNHAVEEEQFLGRIGELENPMTPEELASLVKERLKVGGVKYAPGSPEIRTVAVCGGSAADLLYKAKAAGAQALVTGESKHHLLLDAVRLGITLIDAGHYATEAVVLPYLNKQLQSCLPQLTVEIAETDGDRVLYL